jgi:hypothetical protein
MIFMSVKCQSRRISILGAGNYFQAVKRAYVSAILTAAANRLVNFSPRALFRFEKLIFLSSRVGYARYRADNSAGSAVYALTRVDGVQFFWLAFYTGDRTHPFAGPAPYAFAVYIVSHDTACSTTCRTKNDGRVQTHSPALHAKL